MKKKQQQTIVMIAALGAAVFLLMRRSAAAQQPAGQQQTVDPAGQPSTYVPPQFGVSLDLPDWLTKPWGEFTPPGPPTPNPTAGVGQQAPWFGVSVI